MSKLLKIKRHVDALTVEVEGKPLAVRAFVLFGGVLIVVLLWYLAIWLPVMGHKAGVTASLKAQQQQLVVLAQEIQKMVLGDTVDSGAGQQKLQLQRQLADLDKRFDLQAGQLVPANKMDDVLREVLASVTNLQLLNLNNIPEVSVGAGAISGVNSVIYQYGLKMTFSGNYFDTLGFLQQISALPTHFFWESLDYQVGIYPDATIILQLHTLGRTVGVAS